MKHTLLTAVIWPSKCEVLFKNGLDVDENPMSMIAFLLSPSRGNPNIEKDEISSSFNSGVDDDDLVRVYHGEYRISAWYVRAAPWSIYHSGLLFQVGSKNEPESLKYTIDFNAAFNSNISHILIPAYNAVVVENPDASTETLKAMNDSFSATNDDAMYAHHVNINDAVETLRALLTEKIQLEDGFFSNIWSAIRTNVVHLRSIPFLSYFSGSLLRDMKWYNSGILRFRDYWPDTYNRTLIGTTSLNEFRRLRIFLATRFSGFYDSMHVSSNIGGVSGKTFDPISMINIENGLYVTRSRTCHDMTEDGIRFLISYGMKAEENLKFVFRDHLVAFSSGKQKIEILEEYNFLGRFVSIFTHEGYLRRTVLRFMRLHLLIFPKIREQFIYAREFGLRAQAVGLPAVLYSNGFYYLHDPWQSPFINYCYLPIRIDPQNLTHETPLLTRNVSKLCTLPTEPLDPSGLYLSIGERFIQFEHMLDSFIFSTQNQTRHLVTSVCVIFTVFLVHIVGLFRVIGS